MPIVDNGFASFNVKRSAEVVEVAQGVYRRANFKDKLATYAFDDARTLHESFM